MSAIPQNFDSRAIGLIGSLRCAQLFAGLAAEDLETIAGFSQAVSLARGEYLFHEGEPARGFYVVRSGALNVHRVSASGKEQVIHIFRSGESLAEAALASPAGYPANARAVEGSVVLLVPKEPFLELIRRRPDLCLRMLSAMSAHLRVLVTALEDLTLRDVETRLLNWLMRHHQHARTTKVTLPGTKRTLAAELGTSSETLSRTLSQLRKDRLIAVAARTITLLDPPALAARLRRHLGEI